MVFWSMFWINLISKSVGDRSGSQSIYVGSYKSCFNIAVYLVSNKKLPALGAWLGAILVVVSSWMII